MLHRPPPEMAALRNDLAAASSTPSPSPSEEDLTLLASHIAQRFGGQPAHSPAPSSKRSSSRSSSTNSGSSKGDMSAQRTPQVARERLRLLHERIANSPPDGAGRNSVRRRGNRPKRSSKGHDRKSRRFSKRGKDKRSGDRHGAPQSAVRVRAHGRAAAAVQSGVVSSVDEDNKEDVTEEVAVDVAVEKHATPHSQEDADDAGAQETESPLFSASAVCEVVAHVQRHERTAEQPLMQNAWGMPPETQFLDQYSSLLMPSAASSLRPIRPVTLT